MVKFKTFLWQIYFFLSSRFRVILKRLSTFAYADSVPSAAGGKLQGSSLQRAPVLLQFDNDEHY